MESSSVMSVYQFINNPIIDREISVLNGDGTISNINIFRDYIDDTKLTYWSYHIKAQFDTYIYGSHGSDCFRYGCFVEKDDVVLDIGANMGVFALRAAIHEPSKIICIEPIYENYICLLKNKLDNFECHNIAFGRSIRKQRMEIHTNFTHSGGASMTSDFVGEGLSVVAEQSVMVFTLDFMFENGLLPKIDFMKIDVEGAEFEILDGISDKNLSLINKINIEVHCGFDDDRFKGIVNRLNSLGYKTFSNIYYSGQQQINAWR